MGLLVNHLDATGSILVVIAAALVIAFWHTSAVVSGDYPHDVELFEPAVVTSTTTEETTMILQPKRSYGSIFHQLVSHYPSYVKGEDPVEEYNRRRLHVDTSNYVESAQITLPAAEKLKLLEESLQSLQRKYARKMVKGKDKKRNNLKMAKKSKKWHKKKDPIKRIWNKNVANGTDSMTLASENYPKRYEESDPDVFPYEQSSEANQRRVSLPEESKYFQYFNFFGDGSYNTGLKRGNDRHYIEQHERASKGDGIFQKRVKWADKNGGFGEHYWDFNHV